MNIVYVDNEIDPNLSKFLNTKGSTFFDEEYSFEEVTFKPEEGYRQLFYNKNVIDADIILIDSKLYEDAETPEYKYNGEEIKLLIKNWFPFKEIVVFTQNDLDEGIYYEEKSKGSTPDEIEKDYLVKFDELFKEKYKIIKDYRKLKENFQKNELWDNCTKDKIFSSMEGINEYKELSKEDIDNIVKELKKLEDMING